MTFHFERTQISEHLKAFPMVLSKYTINIIGILYFKLIPYTSTIVLQIFVFLWMLLIMYFLHQFNRVRYDFPMFSNQRNLCSFCFAFSAFKVCLCAAVCFRHVHILHWLTYSLFNWSQTKLGLCPHWLLDLSHIHKYNQGDQHKF